MTSTNDKHEENVKIDNEQIKDENEETKTNTNTVGVNNKETNEISNKDVKKEKTQTSESN